jgi:hypothetical protein
MTIMVELALTSASGEAAVAAAASLLETAGLEVTRSFDLHATRAFKGGCGCPHHGTAVCDCHYAVLMVRQAGAAPAVLLIHGRDGVTWLSLAPDPDEPAGALANRITDILRPLTRTAVAGAGAAAAIDNRPQTANI